ncbi:hypothetical protein SK128_012804 [Halocaridina rubra]|uniref:Uncharacterized protein n=1 Tax=Halocaridina rubra TaxID=373956 RepID=A0AAN8X6X1_HALRR
MPRRKRSRVAKRKKKDSGSDDDGIRTSSEAPGPPRPTEDVTPVPKPFLPSPPVVLGRALTAEDGRRALLLHLLRLEE